MTDGDQAIELVVVDQVVQVTRHALHRRDGIARQAVAAMAARVPAQDAMMRRQLVEEWRPLLVTGGPAVQHDDWRTFPGDLYVDLFAIVSKEMRHGQAPGEPGTGCAVIAATAEL